MDSMREVEQMEALAMAELIPEIMLVLETSAKDNTNVEQAFVELATELKVFIFQNFNISENTFYYDFQSTNKELEF